MDARVGQKMRPQPLSCRQDRMHALPRPQSRLPGPGDSMKSGGDAIANKLAVGLHERHVVVEGHARPRHELPLEGIAMNVDQAGQDEHTAGIDPPPWRCLSGDSIPVNEDRLAIEATWPQRPP